MELLSLLVLCASLVVSLIVAWGLVSPFFDVQVAAAVVRPTSEQQLAARKELLLSDVLGTDSDVVMRPIEADVDRQLLQTAVSHLSPRERDIITMRFGLGGGRELTQKEVADRLGISQSYISRLEKRIILRLRREILRMS